MRPGNPAASKYRCSPTLCVRRIVFSPFAAGFDSSVRAVARGISEGVLPSAPRQNTALQLAARVDLELQQMRKSPADVCVARRQGVGEMERKSGPRAAMKFQVSARLKLPCIPCPFCNGVSAMFAAQIVGRSQPVVCDAKLTTMAGTGVTALPMSPISSMGQRASHLTEATRVDEEAARIVVPEKRSHHCGRELACGGFRQAVGDIHEIRATVCRNDDLRFIGGHTDDAVAAFWMRSRRPGDFLVGVIRIEETQLSRRPSSGRWQDRWPGSRPGARSH